MSVVEQPHSKVANRLTSTKLAGGMVKEYWDRLFTARERGAQVVWYNGAALNPFFQAAGIEWCHGEAFGARLAAMHLEGPAQLAGEEYGYVGELCSYARTHLGCAVLTQRGSEQELTDSGVVGLVDQDTLASRLPTPDFYINAYAGCSTGQQWDEIAYRIFDKSDSPVQGLLSDAVGQQAGLRLSARPGVGGGLPVHQGSALPDGGIHRGADRPEVRLGCAARVDALHQARGGDPSGGDGAVPGGTDAGDLLGTGSRASPRSTSCPGTRLSSTISPQ